MTEDLFKTEFQKEKEARENAIYEEWRRLRSEEERSKTLINKYLMEKYNIHGMVTIYAIIKRVEKRRKKLFNKQNLNK